MNARPSDLPGFMFMSYPVYGLCLTARFPDVFEAKLVFPYVLSLQPLHKGCEERPDDPVYEDLSSWTRVFRVGLLIDFGLGHMMNIDTLRVPMI